MAIAKQSYKTDCLFEVTLLNSEQLLEMVSDVAALSLPNAELSAKIGSHSAIDFILSPNLSNLSSSKAVETKTKSYFEIVALKTDSINVFF